MVFATVQLNVTPECGEGFREGMTWYDIRKTLNGVLSEELHTEKGKNYPLHYVRKGFF